MLSLETIRTVHHVTIILHGVWCNIDARHVVRRCFTYSTDSAALHCIRALSYDATYTGVVCTGARHVLLNGLEAFNKAVLLMQYA